VKDGLLQVPDTPGWGIEPIEERILARPPLKNAGLFRPRPAT
jgi:L-alanine-DL-glutamate epimerase-like enolase superfamily enzyme